MSEYMEIDSPVNKESIEQQFQSRRHKVALGDIAILGELKAAKDEVEQVKIDKARLLLSVQIMQAEPEASKKEIQTLVHKAKQSGRLAFELRKKMRTMKGATTTITTTNANMTIDELNQAGHLFERKHIITPRNTTTANTTS